jgi:hypothetical protein
MKETRASYLTRIIPDLASIGEDIREAQTDPSGDGPSSDYYILSDYYITEAIRRTAKLLEDLERAKEAKP